jgi:hypothetical protein
MSALAEAHRYGRHDDDRELTPYTAGADEPDVTPEQIQGMMDKVFNLGWERKRQLDDYAAKKGGSIQQLRDGSYFINSAHKGQYADFYEEANYNYLKEKFKWLHSVSEGLGFDEDKGAESHGEFEVFLASIPHDEWTEFFSEMDQLEDYPLLDEDGASELEMKEQGRWMEEDGGPDLIRDLIEAANDAYEGFLFTKITIDLVWEWCRETEHYPEAQGQGDVWMNMEELAKKRETQEWFLDHLKDDVAGWQAAKQEGYASAAAGFDGLLKAMAAKDESLVHVYNRLDNESQFRLFLEAFPDERRNEDDPCWFLWKPHYNEPGLWRVGFDAERGPHYTPKWEPGYVKALEYLAEAPWFSKLYRETFARTPEGHPELKLEAQGADEAAEFDPDDPEIYMRYGGGLREELMYEDDKIVVMYSRDFHTLNYHLRLSGLREIDQRAWQELFYNKDIFIVIGKGAPDTLGHSAKRELGIIWGSDSGPLQIFTGSSVVSAALDQLLANPDYGKSIRRMLLQYYRANVKRGFSKCANILLQLGGVSELRRTHRHGDIEIDNFGLSIGLHYIKRHQYGLAAKALKRSLKTITPEGAWLIFDDVSDLSSCFKNDDAANTVFSHDTSDWFDYYYEKQNRPKVKDVIPFLDESAIKHIREVLVNRRVWFPDGGPDQRGEYVVLTSKVLAEYDDDTVLGWLADPSDEDNADEVFDDIIEAVQLAGVDILMAASQDTVHTGFVEAAVNAIDGQQHKWTTHPTKMYASGAKMDAFMVFVPWRSIFDWADTYLSEHEYAYDGDLESLAVQANEGTVNPDVTNLEAGWDDVNKDYAKEQLERIHELTPPKPGPGMSGYDDPLQVPLPLGEGLDDPDAFSKLFSGIPVELEKQVKAQLQDFSELQGNLIDDVQIEWKYRSGTMDELQISFQVEGIKELDYSHWRWALDRVRCAVAHTFKKHRIVDSWLVNGLAEGRIIMRFSLSTEPLPMEDIPF